MVRGGIKVKQTNKQKEQGMLLLVTISSQLSHVLGFLF